MNRYLKEVARVIRGLGITVSPDEENDLLDVGYQESPLCIIGTTGIRDN